MNIVDKVKEYVLKQIEDYKINSEDNYDFWNEHIKYAYEESLKLAKNYNADIEIVSLGALLHDIALINKIGDRKDHHINGEIIAKQILEEFEYDKEKMERVLKCVYNHRSSKNSKSIEETCVADADILAHFDNIPMIFNYGYNRLNIGLNGIREWIKTSFEKDYSDLSDITKEQFRERYELIKDVVLHD